MLLQHIGYTDLGKKLNMAIEICGQYEKKIATTGRDTGATGREVGEYIVSTVRDSSLESRWNEYVAAE